MKNKKESLEKRTWNDFRNAGMVWFINRILHVFGWAIVYELRHGSEDILDVYPCRCRFRGFHKEDEERGFREVTNFVKKNIRDLVEDLDHGDDNYS